MQTAIVPVPFWKQSATRLKLTAGQFGPPPWYLWELTDETGKVFDRGTIQMSAAQWNAWPAGGDDNDYQLNAICSLLNLTRA